MIQGVTVQDPRFQRALEEGRQRMQGPVPSEGGPTSLASWLEQGRPPAHHQPWGQHSPALPLPQPEALYDQRPPEQSRMRESSREAVLSCHAEDQTCPLTYRPALPYWL